MSFLRCRPIGGQRDGIYLEPLCSFTTSVYPYLRIVPGFVLDRVEWANFKP
jgi:hypothetical protein